MDWTAALTPTIGATGLLAGFVLAILTGRLVPKASLDDLRADKDKQIEIWRTAYETSMATQEVQRQQLSALIDANRTTTRVIQAIPEAVGLNEKGARRELAEAEEG